MKSTFRLIRRFIKILLLSVFGLFVLNIVLFLSLSAQGVSNAGGWEATKAIGQELQETDSGFVLSEHGQDFLNERQAWAILVQDGTGNVFGKAKIYPMASPFTTQQQRFLIILAAILQTIPQQLLPVVMIWSSSATQRICIGSI